MGPSGFDPVDEGFFFKSTMKHKFCMLQIMFHSLTLKAETNKSKSCYFLRMKHVMHHWSQYGVHCNQIQDYGKSLRKHRHQHQHHHTLPIMWYCYLELEVNAQVWSTVMWYWCDFILTLSHTLPLLLSHHKIIYPFRCVLFILCLCHFTCSLMYTILNFSIQTMLNIIYPNYLPAHHWWESLVPLQDGIALIYKSHRLCHLLCIRVLGQWSQAHSQVVLKKIISKSKYVLIILHVNVFLE